VTMMKYSDRLPHRKIRKSLSRMNDIDISGATIFDLTKRATEAMRPEYERIMGRIRIAEHVYADETSMKVNGKNCWAWVFVSGKDVIVVIADSRGRKVIERTLGKDFRGIIICDGWKSYSVFTKRIQRCWAHLLREADALSEDFEEGKELSNELHSIFRDCRNIIEEDPPPDQRKQVHEAMKARMRQAISRKFTDKKMQKFAKKIDNGFDYWFTFILHPYIEPTNNTAERALRETVVHRKIIGTLRNEKGMFIHETAMSVIATWENMGLNPYEELIRIL